MADPKYDAEKAVEHGSQDLDSDSEGVTFNALIAKDQSHAIKLRTMSWQKAAWLLAGDQVCLAIMAQSWSLSVLGWVPGIITMLLAGIFFYFTSMTMWRFIMKNPQIHDICDFGYYALGKNPIAYHFTAFMLLANNIMLIGFHVLTGAKILNTLSDHSQCTVVFNVIITLLGILMSLPRTLNHVSFMSMFSAACMGLAILLFMIFAGIEDAPLYGYNGDYPTVGPVHTYALTPKGTTFVAAMNAVLNITFLWVPQILFPTFIAEMEKPEDFPKSLAVLAGLSAFLFIVPPAIGFRYLGQYATAPAFGSLGVVAYKKASFAFVIVPTLVIGVIYANVSAKYVYKHVMRGSHHEHSNTVVGWGVWAAVMAAIWWIGFIFAEVIPSMGDFLSLLGAAFDSFFGFIYFAIAYWQMHKHNLFGGLGRTGKTVFHGIVFIVGLFLLGPGLYAACEAIIADYSGDTRPAFSCANVAI
ncbi:putative amino acid transporter [Lophiostoma macrostomum CBS 122681]|uniref:Putative amino acid transporter n=1 Tax=Lophiostoma macrostomum CBS 122681 TaxID=1314788 RepID=A0A6A6T4I7_9PLEO|nr:putative amino acid transporter [Lophiostoma macrostomum CBS 122681]